MVERVLAATGAAESTGAFLSQSSVSAAADADLLEFRVEASSADWAMRLATAYARQFTRYRQELDRKALETARQELERRIAELRDASGGDRTSLEETLLAKEQELRTLEALQPANGFLVRAADEATRIQPRVTRNVLVGVIVGLLAAAGFAFLVEALDTRLRSATEIADRLGIPLLARIRNPGLITRLHRRRALSGAPSGSHGKSNGRPRFDVEAAGNRELVVLSGARLAALSDPYGEEAEAFRVLRTNLDFARLDGSWFKTIMVTSAVEDEGKSTVVANLAVTLARTGSRVLALDLDLRQPCLERLFGLSARPGITDVALGRSTFEAALTPLAVVETGGDPASPVPLGASEALELLASGPLPPDAGEFAGTAALLEILDAAATRSDVVLIDTPPLLRFGDALTISRHVDALIVVTKLDVIRRPALDELERILASCPTRKLGVVVLGSGVDQAYGPRSGVYAPPTSGPHELASR